MSEKKAFLKGTLILTISAFMAKLIGFFNRIFLSQLIGARELGVYQLIFPVYLLAFSLTCQGIQTGLSNLVAYYHAKKEDKNMKFLLYLSIFLSSLVAFLMMGILYFFSAQISTYFLKTPECYKSIKILAFALPFVTLKGCLNGYYYGVKKPLIPSIASLLEQIFRVFSIYLVATLQLAKQEVSLAVLGLVIGEIVSCLFTFISLFTTFHHKSKQKDTLTSPIILGKKLLALSLPLTANRFICTLLQSIEAILIPFMLNQFYHNVTLSLELYGILNGIALPFILFPSALTNSLSVMLLPTISSATATHNINLIQKTCCLTLHYCLLIGICFTHIFLFFGDFLGQIFIQNQLAGSFLASLSFLCPFVYLSATTNSILNGLGKTNLTLLHTLLSILIRIGFIVFLTPVWGMKGYMLGLLVSFFILCFAHIYGIHCIIPLTFTPVKSVIIPAILTGIPFLLLRMLRPYMPVILFIILIIITSFVSFLFMYLLGCFHFSLNPHSSRRTFF